VVGLLVDSVRVLVCLFVIVGSPPPPTATRLSRQLCERRQLWRTLNINKRLHDGTCVAMVHATHASSEARISGDGAENEVLRRRSRPRRRVKSEMRVVAADAQTRVAGQIL
jgi:hypothetical protein